jgi:hypothetical protein
MVAGLALKIAVGIIAQKAQSRRPESEHLSERNSRARQNETGVSAKLLKAAGAGEGNRTLVFSLEVEEFCNVFNGHSDISQLSG